MGLCSKECLMEGLNELNHCICSDSGRFRTLFGQIAETGSSARSLATIPINVIDMILSSNFLLSHHS